MRLIDTMAMYKLNKLKLHLSDDEGWRLEIPELPELTGVCFFYYRSTPVKLVHLEIIPFFYQPKR